LSLPKFPPNTSALINACPAWRIQYSRNLAIGVFDGSNDGFTGTREKFGRRYLFTEYHSDQAPPYSTTYPLEEPEACPEPISEQGEALFLCGWPAWTFCCACGTTQLHGV